MVKEIPLVPLFEQFIKESRTGKRRKLNGERLKPLTIYNYENSLKHLKGYEEQRGKTLRLKTNIRNNMRLILQERNYWKRFYIDFSNYLYHNKNCYDNFVGSTFKNVKCFFRYLKNEKYLLIPHCYESFYVRREEIRIISLLPEQFVYLIMDKELESRLTRMQKRYKDMFVFGCTAALRYSDLMNLKVRNVELKNNQYFLVFTSQKTGTLVQLKLPLFAVDIFNKYARYKKPCTKLFPSISLGNFNKRIQSIGKIAGWTECIGKIRNKNGKGKEIRTQDDRLFLFCDQLTSHTMRKTGITVLLMLGMQEYLVRKISGHSAHSKEFFRYVNFAQSFISGELDKAHQKLISLYHQP